MTGRERFVAAFSAEGTPEFPAAICYHGIFLRDHWEQVTERPWWFLADPDPARAALPWIDLYEKLGDDWLRLPLGRTRQEQREITIESTPAGVFRVNRVTGAREALHRPPVGGDQNGADAQRGRAGDVRDIGALDARLEELLGPRGGPSEISESDAGRLELPHLLRRHFAADKYTMMHVSSPYWRCYDLWGFNGMMAGLFDFPELIEHACERLLEDSIRQVHRAAAAGADSIWIEECMTDLVSPDQYERFCLGGLRGLTEAIRAAGLRSVHYFCGSPEGKWKMLLDSGADGLALEEGKKGFEIDIAAVCEQVAGRMTVFGNIDAIGVLEKGSDEELEREIARQVEAGRGNGNRFVVSVGSPVTPLTPLSRVQRYCDLAHELGGE